ncbi:methionyl-tRNA formyltransferase [Candidatus Peregrinibacteria bacterium]|nr:methionyl-tRNA formyltransferase [Candidatus Peregrinibacteria bacterium]
MQQLSVIFIGTAAFGVPILNALACNSGFQIPFVITGQDKPKGRGLKLSFSPIKNASIANKLIVQQPKTINELKQQLMQTKPDYLLVVAYSEIIKKEILDIPVIGAVNVHASLLPKYRGASPIQEAILHGDSQTGITWIKMDSGMDTGDIIAQKSLLISENDTFETLAKLLSDLAAQNTVETLKKFAENKISTPQNNSLATYCRKIQKNDGFIDTYKQTAQEILRKIRAYTPWPGCSILWNGKRLKITQAAIGEQKISSGEIKILNSKTLAIGTLKETLLPLKVQPESKREMDIEEFIRGLKK